MVRLLKVTLRVRDLWERSAALRKLQHRSGPPVTFEIYLNSDNTISIVTTNVDPAVKDGTPAAKSRAYAVAA